LSFLEFFAAGKPVVSTDASGIPELIEDKRGKVSKRNNPKNLAMAMLQMAELPDAELEDYRDNGINFIRNYPDWDESASNLVKVFET
jgi:glycosyltransferase involved in cell wall biosynthesis